jgi:hypothetical protein
MNERAHILLTLLLFTCAAHLFSCRHCSRLDDKKESVTFAALVKKTRKIYSLFHKCSALIMIITLLWLTVSTPFVIAFQQELAKQERLNKQSPVTGTDDNNPLSNNTEEKVPGNSNSFSEEFLHDLHVIHYFVSAASQYNKCEEPRTYIAFHGELLVPPPNSL